MDNINLQIIWDALHSYREDLIPEGRSEYDEQWDEICYQMALISEKLEVEQ